MPGASPGILKTYNLIMIKIGNTRYMTINDYSKHKRVTIQTVYNWIKNDEVKTKQLFGKKLIEL